MVSESSFETGGVSAIRGSRVLVKVVLFQLRRPGCPRNDELPIFSDSRISIFELSIDVSFVKAFIWRGSEIRKKCFPP